MLDITIHTTDSLPPERVLIAVAELYAKAFSEGTMTAEANVAFRTDQLPRHSQRAGFRLSYATVGERVIGFAYGYIGAVGQFWSDWIIRHVPTSVSNVWIGSHFEFVELVVDTEFRRQGVAKMLHDSVLNGTTANRALLTTNNHNEAALKFYLKGGWEILDASLPNDTTLLGRTLR